MRQSIERNEDNEKYMCLICTALICTVALSACSKRDDLSSSTESDQSQPSVAVSLDSDTPEESSFQSETQNPTTDDTAYLVKQAETLTLHLVASLERSAIEGRDTLTQQELNNFILLSFRYIEDPAYMYHDIVRAEDMYVFPAGAVNRVAYEIAGENKWILSGGDVVYDEQQQVYETSLGFGIGGVLSCEDLNVELSSDGESVLALFTLTDNAGFKGEDGWNDYGNYQIKYTVVRENDDVFLRFGSISKG